MFMSHFENNHFDLACHFILGYNGLGRVGEEYGGQVGRPEKSPGQLDLS